MNYKNVVQEVAKIVVPAVAGAVITFLTHLLAHLSPGQSAILYPAATGSYFALIHWLKVKFPKLAWLIGDLPQPPVA